MRLKWRLLLLAASVMLCFAPTTAQSEGVLWTAWERLEVDTIGDDNTGSSVSMAEVDGMAVLMITPGGTSDETKLAIPFTGADLVEWANYTQLDLQIYLPETNRNNPNRFFLGMADVTDGGFTWIAGVFSDTQPKTGWNTVSYPLDRAMQNVAADRHYNLYFSFFHEQGSKIPLTEPFYLRSVHLVSTSDDAHRQEVDHLLGMEDDLFLDTVAKETFDFFWLEANPTNGLIKDRSTPNSASSIASVGFGLAAIPVAVDRGWISYDEGLERARTTLNTFVSGGVQGEHGFFFHFVNMETGRREWNSELSSIDTALLVAGALVAGQYFEGTEVQTLANRLYENVDWDWMRGGGEVPKMGWDPETGFIDAAWDHFDESLILYVLAIGSPTHPIPASTWDLWKRPVSISGGYIYLPGEPLFVYQYPLAFLNLRGKEDKYANYWNNTILACQRNHQFAIKKSDKYITYQNGVWGISASDGPSGYRAYGASDTNHDGTVAPYAAAACLPFTPDIALEGMRAILKEYGILAWREYGFVSAINEDKNWYSRDHIGIDQGDILLMIANYQDGLVWDLFMANPSVQKAINAMGFIESSGDYAVTPAYMAEVTSR